MAQKRKDWNGLISGFKASDLVFLDESGCNTDMTRRYAYSLGGSRAVDSAPLSKPKNTTILSSIQLDGTLRYTTFSGGTTVERFKRYLETDLLPHLNGNSVLIMDNMKSHHAKAVRNLLDSSGVRYIYLPPYSPDLNPIEKLWSKVKAFLQFRLLTAQAGSIPAAIRLIFENCYKLNNILYIHTLDSCSVLRMLPLGYNSNHISFLQARHKTVRVNKSYGKSCTAQTKEKLNGFGTTAIRTLGSSINIS